MRVDVHNHVIPEAALELLRTDPAYRVTVTGTRLEFGGRAAFDVAPSFRDPDAKLAELRARAVDGAVVSPAPPLFMYDVPGVAMARACNAGMAAFAAAHPDRYRWMAHVPMGQPELAVEVLEEALAAGAVGAEVGTSIAGRRLDEPDFEPFWASAERAGIPVMLHPAYNEAHRGLRGWYLQNVLGNPLETTVAVVRLLCAGVLDRHPGLRVVAVHAGGFFPYQAGRLRHAASVRPELAESPPDPWAYRGRLLVDTIAHDREALAYLVSRMGPASVVLGSDLPFDMALDQPYRELEAAVGEETARTISEENAARLYGIGG
jgi:aminocarboxymuconate-semialdehyde decarboxylase